MDNRRSSEALRVGGSTQQSLTPEVTVSADLVREELERVLSSRTFQVADAQKRFLQYAVEQTVAGCQSEIKEHTLGIEVFKRGLSFDPRIDPIVRVEVRKLRSRLAKYYDGEGQHDVVRIMLPARGYVPAFREVDPARISTPPELPPTTQREPALKQVSETAGDVLALFPEELSAGKPAWGRPPILSFQISSTLRRSGVLAAAVLLAAAAIYAGRLILSRRAASPTTPSIAVLPFQNLGDIKDISFSDGLTDELIDSRGEFRACKWSLARPHFNSAARFWTSGRSGKS